MKVHSEISLSDFKFWSGAVENVKSLSLDQLEEVECILDDLYPDGIDETVLNDLFWFDFDKIQDWLGIEDEDKE